MIYGEEVPFPLCVLSTCWKGCGLPVGDDGQGTCELTMETHDWPQPLLQTNRHGGKALEEVEGQASKRVNKHLGGTLLLL